jgi:protein SCO1/2
MRIACLVAALLGLAAFGPAAAHPGHGPASALSALDASVVPIDGAEPLRATALVGTDGKPFAADGLRGRWTVLFFGFTSCTDVCPTTLATLAAVARDPASGVAEGRTRIVFVTMDPARDTPRKMREYLSAFDKRIVGLTGSAEALRRFAAGAGADAAEVEGGIDHSTSLFVLDADARPVAVFPHPGNAKRIVADFDALRLAHAATTARAR